ncbi:hypothetical protein I4U23_026986 [Adineta vaga]|nr:hypothetical protein I4U23_026986 [Adineta vaga]
MFTTFSIISHHTKSKYINLLRTIISSKQINIDIEMKKLNDRKEFVKALDLFDKHKQQTILTDRIIVQAFKACTQLGYLERGQIIHKNLSDSSLNNSYIQTSLINFYMQCGRVNDAQRVFDSSVKRTSIHYGSMMKGFIKNNMADKAIELFSKITHPDEIQLCLLFNSCAQLRTKQAFDFGKKVWSEMSSIHHKNEYILTSTFDMFVKCGDLEKAKNVFIKIKRVVMDYGQMMTCYNEHSMHMKTIDLYEKTKDEGIQANAIIFLLLIDACGQLGIESRCRSIVNQIPSRMLNDLKLQNALVHMWGKVGCVDEAKKVFEQIDQPDAVTYSSMINAYGLNGMGHDAIELYYRMPSKMINEKTYPCILNACSHAGLVHEARTIFSTIQMKNKWIYTSMIDCLSRSFLFDEAKQLIEEYERQQSPCLPMYTSLLSGARNRHDAYLARQTVHRIRELFQSADESLVPTSILFTNTLASAGELEEASQIRWNMSQLGARKQIGLSWTEVNSEIVVFRVQDRSHPRTREIYDELDRLEKELIEHGHKFDPSWITRPLIADETVESVLNSHSERLALAYNFIQRPIPSRIQIVKNLRICGDCHGAIKLISQIRGCTIIVRDANRVHHFSDGKCISISEVLRTKPIYKEFILMNQQSNLLSNGKQTKISSIKSLHSERLKLQFMCEDDKYEQDKFQQWNQFVTKDQQHDQTDILFSVCDMRTAFTYHGGNFDIVISCDNSIPHLLTDDDILITLKQMFSCLRPGGGCLITIRDYDQEQRGGKNLVKPYGKAKIENGKRYVALQVWDFDEQDDQYYDFTLYVIEEDLNSKDIQTHAMHSRYYAIKSEKLMKLMNDAGFENVVRLNEVFYQPVFIGTRPDT